MQTIGKEELAGLHPTTGHKIAISNSHVRKSEPIQVGSYLELANKVAEVQYLNPQYVVLFRGQSSDHLDSQDKSTLRPSIFRGEDLQARSRILRPRFDTLDRAERLLVQLYRNGPFPNGAHVDRYRILRWSILQHYEICNTPLLDVTHSLRIAVSFAADHNGDDGYVFLIGIPQLAGVITTSIDAGLQTVRLSSVCPPHATRPHIQEGYLLGEFPDIAIYEQKQMYTAFEVDFGRRLIAKFRFKKSKFISNADFPLISRAALYPDDTDPFIGLATELRRQLKA